jgi:hypothetical protein
MMAPPDFHVGQGILGEVEVRVNVCVKSVEPLLRLLWACKKRASYP